MYEQKGRGVRLPIFLMIPALVAQLVVSPASAQGIQRHEITVLDGDTVAARGVTYRLVGFDTPERGSRARCPAEAALAEKASARLNELLGQGPVSLERVACACRPGTEGTSACNYKRLCAVLKAAGNDVGPVLIREELARPYHCGSERCPRRVGWCR
jgi:endonuclease YncB( thermonuclease family)